MIEKYGSVVPPKAVEAAKARVPHMLKKGRETMLAKYGVENPGQMPNHRSKCEETPMKNYGVSHPALITERAAQIEKEKFDRLFELFSPAATLLGVYENAEKAGLYPRAIDDVNFHCNTCNNDATENLATAKWRMEHSGSPCRGCSGVSVGSVKQAKLEEYVNSLGVKTIPNYKLNGGRQIDVFCPDYDIGIEFDGLFWHNESRVGKLAQLRKTHLPEQEGIRLVHVFEDEWDWMHEQTCSHIKQLFQRAVGVGGSIEGIPDDAAKEFLTKYGMEKNHHSQLYFGISELSGLAAVCGVSCITSGEWVIDSVCCSSDRGVDGCISKMVEELIGLCPIQELYYHEDARWPLFKNHGGAFDIVSTSEPKCWFASSTYREATEIELARFANIFKIWDCGKTIWRYNRLE